MKKGFLAYVSIAITCMLVTHPVIANDAANQAVLADNFVHALQQQRFKDAAGMFTPEATHDMAAVTVSLKRIGDHIGGFSTLHLVPALPNGNSVQFQVPRLPLGTMKILQFRYTATAIDGKPVFYELDLTADQKPPRVLSFALQIPTPDAQSEKRAVKLMDGVYH